MRRFLLVLALASTLAVAGCLGGGGDDADTASTADPSSQDQQDQLDDGGNETATNETDDGPDFTWNRTSYSGTAPGPNGVFVYTPGPTHNVTVVEDTRNLTINASSPDGELLVDIYPPGCEDNDNQRGSECSHTADTANGGTWSTEDPDAGTWQVQVSKGDPGTGSTSYDLTADRLEPTDQAGTD